MFSKFTNDFGLRMTFSGEIIGRTSASAYGEVKKV